MVRAIKFITVAVTAMMFAGCGKVPSGMTASGVPAMIYPDYSAITLPPNIAPMNFRVLNPGERYRVFIAGGQGRLLKIRSADGQVRIPERQWKRLLARSEGSEIRFTICRKEKRSKWERLDPFGNKVAEEAIDPYIVFRKILPANILWKEMGIYQRSLETFRESPIMVNSLTDDNCMNCHSFSSGDPEHMLFHMRGAYGGTLIRTGEEMRFLNTKLEETMSSAVYPSWHPGGELIAFSVNMINQGFHASMGKSSYVLDKYSDIILYDLKTNSITRPALLATQNLENMPVWSADGKRLYFLSTGPYNDTVPFFETRYSLLSIPFDERVQEFGSIDTLIDAEDAGMSITFPREQPNGTILSFVGIDYGYFSINNQEADVYFLDLESGEVRKPPINSDRTESYPSWSANGAWLMFVSKRDDGLISQPWFCHVDPQGNASKPFVLPQKDPDFYPYQMFNFNRPEFAKARINLHPREIYSLVRQGSVPVKFNEKASVNAATGATIDKVERVGQPGSIYHHD